MESYRELRDRQQKEFNELPLGFAFSDKQFDEMMEKWGLDPEKDLDNHEYGYTGDFEDTLDRLGLTWEEVAASPRLLKALDKASSEIRKREGC